MDVTENARKVIEGYYEKRKEENLVWHSKIVVKQQENDVVSVLKHLNPKSIFEVGCGYGKYTKFMTELFHPERFVALDLGKELIQQAKKYVQNEKIEFVCLPIQDYNTEEKFDLVFAGGIINMISPDQVQDVVKKLVSLSKHKIVSFDPVGKFNRKEIKYNFWHDYEKLFKSAGVKNVKKYDIKIPFGAKMVSSYAKLRGRSSITRQAVFEIDV